MMNQARVQQLIIESTAVEVIIPELEFKAQVPTWWLKDAIQKELNKMPPASIGKLS